MKTLHDDRYTRELGDHDLSALLKGAFADDPALEDAPGRTERIMRRIKAAEVRPRSWFTWQPFAWAGGGLAAAAAVVAIIMSLGVLPVTNLVQGPKMDPPVIAPAPPKNTDGPQIEDNNTVAPEVAKPAPEIAKRRQPQQEQRRQPEKPVVKPKPQAVPTEEPSVEIAAAYYSTGKAMETVGDDEMAYYAYQASYDSMPTADAIMASSKALERMTEETLASEG